MTQHTPSIDVFWSFRNPYSYLATGRLMDLQARYALDVRVRPVLPLAVHTPEFFSRVNPLFGPYLVRDVLRLGEFQGIPIRWPRPDPVVMNPDGAYPLEQPFIHRLTRLGVAAAERGCGLSFLDEVSKIIWSGSIDEWHQGSHLAGAADRADRSGGGGTSRPGVLARPPAGRSGSTSRVGPPARGGSEAA